MLCPTSAMVYTTEVVMARASFMNARQACYGRGVLIAASMKNNVTIIQDLHMQAGWNHIARRSWTLTSEILNTKATGWIANPVNCDNPPQCGGIPACRGMPIYFPDGKSNPNDKKAVKKSTCPVNGCGAPTETVPNNSPSEPNWNFFQMTQPATRKDRCIHI